MREKQHQRGLSSSYLEPDRYDDEEEGEEAISLAAIKSKYKGGGGLRGEDKQILYSPVTFVLFFLILSHKIDFPFFLPPNQRSERGSTRQIVMKALMRIKPRG